VTSRKFEWLKVEYHFLGEQAFKPIWVWADSRDMALAKASAVVDRHAKRAGRG
jgi:hypothetical protein